MKREENIARINRKTVYIIRKNRLWLRGKNMLTRQIEWTPSEYDAWRTRDEELAKAVAKKTGGILVMFNPIVNIKKIIGGG